MQELDFNKVKKEVLTIILPDNEKLLVRKPTKRIMDQLLLMSSDFERLQEEELSEQTLSDIYLVCSEIMSNNRQGKNVSETYLSELLDIEDLVLFFNTYTTFINSISEVKN